MYPQEITTHLFVEVRQVQSSGLAWPVHVLAGLQYASPLSVHFVLGFLLYSIARNAETGKECIISNRVSQAKEPRYFLGLEAQLELAVFSTKKNVDKTAPLQLPMLAASTSGNRGSKRCQALASAG